MHEENYMHAGACMWTYCTREVFGGSSFTVGASARLKRDICNAAEVSQPHISSVS